MAYRDALFNELDPQEDPTRALSDEDVTRMTGSFGSPVGGGFQAPVDPTTTPIEGGPVSPPSAPVDFLAGNRGFDPGKLNDPPHQTERYQLARVQQQHDPSLGITDAFLADANKLGIGDFYRQSGDRLGVNNVRAGARWLPGTGDIIKNFTGEGPKEWAPLMTGDEAPAPSGTPATTSSLPDPRSLPFSGTPTEMIDAGTQAYGGDDPSPYLAALLAELGLGGR